MLPSSQRLRRREPYQARRPEAQQTPDTCRSARTAPSQDRHLRGAIADWRLSRDRPDASGQNRFVAAPIWLAESEHSSPAISRPECPDENRLCFAAPQHLTVVAHHFRQSVSSHAPGLASTMNVVRNPLPRPHTGVTGCAANCSAPNCLCEWPGSMRCRM